MTDFTGLSVLRFKSLGRRRYRFLDDNGQVAAEFVQVEGGKARGRIVRRFAYQGDSSRCSLKGVSADGTILFFVERTGAPEFVVLVRMPDGTALGRIESNPRRGTPRFGKHQILQERWRLIDAGGIILCEAEREVRKEALGTNPPNWGKTITYIDPSGVSVASFDGERLEMNHQSTDLLHTTISASLMAFDLLAGA